MPKHEASLRPGQPFNPYRMFKGLFIPEGLARCDWISPGAKLAWGRLARYVAKMATAALPWLLLGRKLVLVGGRPKNTCWSLSERS
jgi:hypothetical protein